MRRFGGIFVETDEAAYVAEIAAARCVSRCCSAVVSLDHAVPVELWAERYLRYDVEFADLDEPEGMELLGHSVPGTNRIVLNARHESNRERLRFTLAHEIGHHELNHLVDREATDSLCRTEPASDAQTLVSESQERQADRFARAFLMPPASVHAVLKSAVDHGVVSRAELEAALGDYPRGTEAWRERLFPMFCSRFEVTGVAGLRRLSELRIAESGTPLLNQFHLERLLS